MVTAGTQKAHKSHLENFPLYEGISRPVCEQTWVHMNNGQTRLRPWKKGLKHTTWLLGENFPKPWKFLLIVKSFRDQKMFVFHNFLRFSKWEEVIAKCTQFTCRKNISRVPHRPNFQMKIASLSDEGSNESSVFRAFDRAFIRKASYFHRQMGVLFLHIVKSATGFHCTLWNYFCPM